MKKELIRREYFKLIEEGHTNNQCRIILRSKYNFEICIRTLRRWTERLNKTEWDFKDQSTRPKTIHTKIDNKIEKKVLDLRSKTGWGEDQIQNYVSIGHTSVNKILRKHKLTKPSKRRKKRNNYVRFEREHPNTMWQIDHSDQKVKDKWLIQ